MKALLETLEKRLNKQEDVCLVTVVASSGAAPRGAGARMLVCAEGRVYGTIGGGAVEYESERLAKEALSVGCCGTQRFELRPNQSADIGMVCGGAVQVYFQFISGVDEAAHELCRRALFNIEQDIDCWLIDVLDGKGGLALFDVKDGFFNLTNPPEELAGQIQAKAGRLKAGGLNCFAQAMLRAGKVYIFGGGHVAQELVPVLARSDFYCVVLEDREAFRDPALFPGAGQVLAVDFSNIGQTIAVTTNDFIVIMTRGHQYDAEVQTQAMRTKAAYIGVMGSANKKKHVSEKMKSLGFTEGDLARVKSPIGLAIGAKTPAEIAVSIAAELIARRASGK